jgi:hypothetical protein
LNSDIDETEDAAVRSDGYSTQRNSIMIEHHQKASNATPRIEVSGSDDTSPMIKPVASVDYFIVAEPPSQNIIHPQSEELLYSDPEEYQEDLEAVEDEQPA